MFNNLIPLLFGLILIAYVFSEPVSSSAPSIRLDQYNKLIQTNNIPPPDTEVSTLEENIINNMRPLHTNVPVMPTSSFQPILSSNSDGASLE
jgi:hypothetical protein